YLICVGLPRTTLFPYTTLFRSSSIPEEDCASGGPDGRKRRTPPANICHKLPLVGHMSLNVVVVMDPIDAIRIAKDSTFAMLLEAQRRGHALHYVMPGGLGMDHGRAHALMAPLRVRDDPSGWVELGTAAQRALGPGDLVLMRKEPAVEPDSIHDTLIPDVARARGGQVATDPRGLRDLNAKLAALRFPQCSPPPVVSRDAATRRAFVARGGQAVLE